MPNAERHDVRMSTLYRLRLTISSADKKLYTREEIMELLDTIALAKEQE